MYINVKIRLQPNFTLIVFFTIQLSGLSSYYIVSPIFTTAPLGNAVIQEINIFFLIPVPGIIREPKEIQFEINDGVRKKLECGVDLSYPSATINWLFENKTLVPPHDQESNVSSNSDGTFNTTSRLLNTKGCETYICQVMHNAYTAPFEFPINTTGKISWWNHSLWMVCDTVLLLFQTTCMYLCSRFRSSQTDISKCTILHV